MKGRTYACGVFSNIFFAGPDIADCSYGGLFLKQGSNGNALLMCSERGSMAQLKYPLIIASDNTSMLLVVYSYKAYSSVWVNITFAQSKCQGFLINPCIAAKKFSNPLFTENKDDFIHQLKIKILQLLGDSCVWFHIFPQEKFNTTVMCHLAAEFEIDPRIKEFHRMKIGLTVFFPRQLWSHLAGTTYNREVFEMVMGKMDIWGYDTSGFVPGDSLPL